MKSAPYKNRTGYGMECSSTTLWAEQKLAVEQKVPLMPHRRFPHVFLFISFVTHFIGHLLAITPEKESHSTAINMACSLDMIYIAMIENAATQTKKFVSGKNYRLCRAFVTMTYGAVFV